MNAVNQRPFSRFAFVIADGLLLLASLVAAPALWTVRRIGLHRLPLCRRWITTVGVLPLRRHYYDPYVDRSLLRHSLGETRDVPGIDWNEQKQLALLAQMRYSEEIAHIGSRDAPGRQFRFNNGSFESGDAEFLYQFVRLKKPGRVVEIGSGYSTLLVRDALAANRREDPGRPIKHVCIEPFEMPWLEAAGVSAVRSLVEEVPLDLFEELEEGDLLFIDSSHVIRPQGDVLFEYLSILPRLRRGVLVHIHDIFSPRDYPPEWVLDRMWLWNEQYLVETMLSHGNQWDIVAALNYLKHEHFDALQAACPYLTRDREPGSLYLIKNGHGTNEQ